MINWDAVGAIGEILGAAAVVISLGHLAVQIRHSASINRATIRTQLTERARRKPLHFTRRGLKSCGKLVNMNPLPIPNGLSFLPFTEFFFAASKTVNGKGCLKRSVRPWRVNMPRKIGVLTDVNTRRHCVQLLTRWCRTMTTRHKHRNTTSECAERKSSEYSFLRSTG